MKKNLLVLIFNFLILSSASAESRSCLAEYSKIEEKGLIDLVVLNLKENPRSNKALVVSNVIQGYLEKLNTSFLELNSKLSSVGTKNQIQMSINTSSQTLDSFYSLVTRITESYNKKDKFYQDLLKEFIACKNNLSVCKNSLEASQIELRKNFVDIELLLNLLSKAQQELAMAQDFFSDSLKGDHKPEVEFDLGVSHDSELHSILQNSISQKILTLQSYGELIKQSQDVLKKNETQVIALLGFTIPDAEMQALLIQAQQNIPFEQKELIAKKDVRIVSDSYYNDLSQEFNERLSKSKQTIIGKRIIEKIKTKEVSCDYLYQHMENERMRYMLEVSHQETHSSSAMSNLTYYTLKDLELIFSALIDHEDFNNSWPRIIYTKGKSVESIKLGNRNIGYIDPFSITFLFLKDINDNLYKDFVALYNKIVETKISELNSQITKIKKPSFLYVLSSKGRSMNKEFQLNEEKNYILLKRITQLKSHKKVVSSSLASLILETPASKEKVISLFDVNNNKLADIPLSVNYGKTDEAN